MNHPPVQCHLDPPFVKMDGRPAASSFLLRTSAISAARARRSPRAFTAFYRIGGVPNRLQRFLSFD